MGGSRRGRTHQLPHVGDEAEEVRGVARRQLHLFEPAAHVGNRFTADIVSELSSACEGEL